MQVRPVTPWEGQRWRGSSPRFDFFLPPGDLPAAAVPSHMAIYNFDLETFSSLDLRKVGSYAYARHPSTDVLCAAWRGDNGVSGVWRPGLNTRLVLQPGDEVHGYNIISFDAEVWRWVLATRYGWEWPGYEVFRDTMSRAAYANLPGALGEVARALGTKAKDAIGAKLMQRLCKPAHETIANSDPRRLHSAANLDRLAAYCAEDVEAEAALDPHLPALPPDEVRIEQVTHAMNRRGWRVDLDLVRRLRELALLHTDVLRARMAQASRGAVTRETELAAIADFARSRGVPVGHGRGSMDAEALDAFLADPELDEDVRTVMDVRRQLGRSALAKLDRILACVCDDRRVRGLIQYYGAHQTGRDAGRLVQIQNLPRGIFQGARAYDAALETVRFSTPANAYDLLRMCYERPDVAVTDVLASLIRPCFIAGNGLNLHVSDFSAIEGRVLAWLAGEERILDAYRQGLRLYCVAASGIFNEPYEVINANRGTDPRYKHMDMVGKVVELACIAEGTPVLTDRGLVPIEAVLPGMRVWDGVDWVDQEGTVFRGIKECITYDGLTATTDHLVWVEGEPGAVAFGDAASRRLRLRTTGLGRHPVRVGGDDLAGDSVHAPAPSASLYGGALHRVRSLGLGAARESYARCVQGVPAMQSAPGVSLVAGETLERSEEPLHQPGQQAVGELWWAGDNLRLPLSACRVRLGVAEPRLAAVDGTGPRGQLAGVRTREPSVGYTQPAVSEPARGEGVGSGCGLGGGELPLPPQVHDEALVLRYGPRGRDLPSDEVCSGKSARMADAGPQVTRVRVYDLVNCGPRSRFTAAGKLVHNCGYQGARGAFKAMAGAYGLVLPDEQIDGIVKAWRASRPLTVKFWYDCGDAAIRAVREPGTIITVGRILFRFDGIHLKIRLPSGRCLWYRNARVMTKMTPVGERDALFFYGEGTNGRYCLEDTYGGKIVENITQAASRDLLMHAAVKADAEGVPVVARVHDELVAEHTSTDKHLLEQIMADLPAWADGLPMKSEAFVSPYYRK